ncbi:hypothetical protein [Polymorphobacter fuscus]|uniref:Uncharacterized protein n=1 Tax=Sandarakinorhabdus fusca TaxID=1439888 RepID=A0A7C9GRJ4_9SPHN|nr:hypothetical protein [Polymorphobacter fuscus]KAB7643910.1 hypothetical protein F9290_15275 [Polymorphobacter fuscus]MQT18613.1 hypothetical protein [Polymorphobacter fuscus]NJC07020.1 hypothetical protein [Polymorphobacter fuscus]
MTYVTVTAQNGENFIALPEPVYIVKVSTQGSPDKYVVTTSVWVYESSTPGSDLNNGWQTVKALYDAKAMNSDNILNAVALDSFDVGDGSPVQTQPRNP